MVADCRQSKDCTPGKVCRNNRCDGCLVNQECGTGKICDQGVCKTGDCKFDTHCTGGKICKSNTCSSCTNDSECGTARLCEQGICILGTCRKRSDCQKGLLCSKYRCILCQKDGECSTGELCLRGICAVANCRSTRDCSGGKVCKNNTCSSCTVDRECDTGQLCLTGTCKKGDCRIITDCTVGKLCLNNTCSTCANDKECGTGKLCLSGLCKPGTCRVTGDCPTGKVCKNNTCSSCASDTDCGAGLLCQRPSACLPANCLQFNDCVCRKATCQSNNDCSGGNVCKKGQCCSCANDTDCGSGNLCLSGRCKSGNCRTNNDCTGGKVCKNNTCSTCTQTSDCPAGQFCIQGACKAGNCSKNSDCSGGLVCTNNQCSVCTKDRECNTGQLCIGSICKKADCRTASDCSGGKICKNNTCTACAGDTDCGTGQLCIRGGCKKGDCRANKDCTQGKICKSNTCSSCTNSADCGGSTFSCIGGVCIQGNCTKQSDCSSGLQCTNNRCSDRNIVVILPIGTKLNLDVASSETVATLKLLIQSKSQISASMQTLTMGCKKLHNVRTLGEEGVIKDSVIYVSYDRPLVAGNTNCQTLLAAGNKSNGTYTIDPDGPTGPIKPFKVYCDMISDGGGWTLIHKSNKANTSDRTDAGYNTTALSTNTLNTVAKLPRAMIGLLGDHFRIQTSDGKELHWTGLPYTTVEDKSIDICQVRVKDKWTDPDKQGWGSATFSRHSLCLGLGSPTGHTNRHHLCIQRWCCGGPNSGFWLNGGNWAGAYYSGWVWTKFKTKVYGQTCGDQMKNSNETDVDCGGSCAPCKTGKTCIKTSDCADQLCVNGKCTLRTGANCQAIKTKYRNAKDGVYTVTIGKKLLPVYCDMTTDGGGWALVFKATNRARTVENGVLKENGPVGPLPMTINALMRNKLTDVEINALRSNTVLNNMRVVIRATGFLKRQGVSFHRAGCVFNSLVNYAKGHICLQSTQLGPNNTTYQNSGHPGTLSRWYVGGGGFNSGQIRYLLLGANWGGIHVSPVSNGERGNSLHPGGYCTYYDSRTCPMDSALEVWVK